MFKAKDIMKRNVICVRPEMPIYDAMRLLSSRRISGVAVVDEELNLVGVMSEKDVLCTLFDGEDSEDLTVADFMKPNPVSFDVQGTTLVDVCDCLMENDFRRVFITENGKLAGLVSRSDVITSILRFRHQQAD